MFNKRVKILVTAICILLFVWLVRLISMQLQSSGFYRAKVTELKQQRGSSLQLKTIRGRILDRNGNVLAEDKPRVQLCISYNLARVLDGRLQENSYNEDNNSAIQELSQVINKSAKLGAVSPSHIIEKIRRINDFVWKHRLFQAWRRNFPNSELLKQYKNIASIPFSQAQADFQEKEPEPAKQVQLVRAIDIEEMHKPWPIAVLQTDDDIFAAQLEFMDADGVSIRTVAKRIYPYASAAAQTIGWVGRPSAADKEVFENDRLTSYLSDELCGREDGTEYVCEAILRGRRGEVFYSIDGQRIQRAKTEFGEDVWLTIDIELQQRIESHITNCRLNPKCDLPAAVVVIDVATAEILTLVSTPVFDLDRIRSDYAVFARNPNEPLRNRAINKQYPPGSVIKPFILIAGLETGEITPTEIISCPAKRPAAPPRCWVEKQYHIGHDDEFRGQGGNNARNATKGSCNIYFSRLAGRIEPKILQQWLFNFGFGRNILFVPEDLERANLKRNFRQTQGQISSIIPENNIRRFSQVPHLTEAERRWFGIGQGSLRATVLQVANAMASLARKGFYKQPRLLLNCESAGQDSNTIDLGISKQTLAVVYDGMGAVVNEWGATAYEAFAYSGFAEQGVKVYGKTGSTENPYNAWFAGFAEDITGRSIAIAVVIEEGQSGAREAAPLARDIIQFCIEAEYLGQSQPKVEETK
ncbi:MAG: hypothetical protein JXB29_09095 [Sedimentisphaerales bacterium]|nr:hypothetical protein [Sedimentisphaerales bacterium]